MTQKEYMSIIKDAFTRRIKRNADIFQSYCYNDHRASSLLSDFKTELRGYGLKFSDCYHANGIGNNNDYTIYVEGKDSDGFVIRKDIANFHYCYGIYGGCSVYLKDLATNESMSVGHAR